MEAGYQRPQSLYFNEILAFARMKSAMQMKSAFADEIKSVLITRRKADFITKWFHPTQVGFIPSERTDLAEKNGNRITITVLFWYGRQDLNLHGYPLEPKSNVSANSTTPAYSINSGECFARRGCLASADFPRTGIFYHGRGRLSMDLPAEKNAFSPKKKEQFPSVKISLTKGVF